MKITAIICEYNPLHNGHLHQINEAKRLTGCEAVLCIMSGNFTQRAESSIMDKYERAKVAVLNGADIVVNLPTAYAVNNAEVFAVASVKIANAFKNVNYLCFGMENPDLTSANELADFLICEPESYKLYLKQFLDTGISFNESKVKAITKLIEENKLKVTNKKEFLKLLSMPNNILAVEYIKALKKTESLVKPFAIKRVGSDYNNTNLKGKLSSATAIRETIYKTKKIKKVKRTMPLKSFEALNNYINQNGLVDNNKLKDVAFYKITTSSKTQLKKLYNVTEGLENRLITKANEATSGSEFILKLKTKRYKTSRLNSIMLNCVLNINSSTVKHIYNIKYLPYIKVLAINKNNNKLMKNLNCHSKLILRRNNVETLRQTKFVKELIEIENNANKVYNLLIGKKILAPKDLYTVVKKV